MPASVIEEITSPALSTAMATVSQRNEQSLALGCDAFVALVVWEEIFAKGCGGAR
jgi:hypothetical protein